MKRAKGDVPYGAFAIVAINPAKAEPGRREKDSIEFYLSKKIIRIIVKTNAKTTEITGIDEARQGLKVSVKAPPVEGKANVEIIKYFSRLLKKKVSIKTGIGSKEKLIEIKD